MMAARLNAQSSARLEDERGRQKRAGKTGKPGHGTGVVVTSVRGEVS